MAALTFDEIVEKAYRAYGRASAAYKKDGREIYRDRLQAAEIRLAADLLRLFPTTVPVEIWNKAWSDGHSEGYRRVAEIYRELTELVHEAELRAQGL